MGNTSSPGVQSPLPTSTLATIAERHRAGDSLREIARRLNDARVPTARGRGAWQAQTVRSALQSRRGQAALIGRPDEPPPARVPTGYPHSAAGRAAREARLSAGLTVADVAARCRLSKATVLRVELGDAHVPSAATLAAILIAVGIDAPTVARRHLIQDDGLRVAVLRAMVAADLSEEEILSAAA